jgi:hypothetical protein
VADEDEPQCRLPGLTLFKQVVEVELGYIGEFLIGRRVERCELVF